MKRFKDNSDGEYTHDDKGTGIIPEWAKDMTQVDYDNTPLDDSIALVSIDARKYLRSTDWMLLRELDGGTAMSAEVKDLRAEARVKVI